jgi:DNA-binding XRE family transcriptional regulator
MIEIPELKVLGMSKADLAKEMGISPETVYRWKKVPGYVEAYLKLRLLQKTARKCECSLRIKLVGDGCDVCNPGMAR